MITAKMNDIPPPCYFKFVCVCVYCFFGGWVGGRDLVDHVQSVHNSAKQNNHKLKTTKVWKDSSLKLYSSIKKYSK